MPIGEVDASDVGPLLDLARDEIGWQAVLSLASQLNDDTAAAPGVRERVLLAQAKSDDAAIAAEGLRQLIDSHGASGERWGLLGGRYKQLWRAANAESAESAEAAESAGHLRKAIDAYERGAALEHNEYYAVSNLPALYLNLEPPAVDAARLAARIASTRCEQQIVDGTADEWARPTLLLLAFAARDLPRAQELAAAVCEEGPASWKIETTISDLLMLVPSEDNADAAAFQSVVAELQSLL